MKVIYRVRYQIDKSRVKDYTAERNFKSFWESGDLIYFKETQFNVFSLGKDEIIKITN